MALEAELYSFRLQTANESAAVVLPVKWGVGRGKPLSQVRAVLFYKSVSCWVQSGERSVGYPTIVLLVLVSELQCTVLHKSVCKCKLKNCAL